MGEVLHLPVGPRWVPNFDIQQWGITTTLQVSLPVPSKYIYLIGSLRNPKVPEVAHDLRAAGFSVFDDWYAAGPTADDDWQEYEKDRGRTYLDALEGIAARHAFDLDHKHLALADVGVLVLPAGKSGHLELGWVARQKPTFVLLENGEEPPRWDLMYKLCTAVCGTVEELVGKLKLL